MARYSIEVVKYLMGVRGPRSSLTAQESALLCELAANRHSVVEVGVFEGATSRGIASAIHADGLLYLVDPFAPQTRMEQWIGFSAASFIAHRSLRGQGRKVQFVRMTSLDAAASIELRKPAELIFIDADHSYNAVRSDFHAWTPHLASNGLMALHDSRLSHKRPDLGANAGPVRFADELISGSMKPWTLAHSVDTLSVFRRA